MDDEMLHYTSHMTDHTGSENSEAHASWAALRTDGDYLEQYFATRAPWEFSDSDEEDDS
jgi:hypothetical protein